MRNQKNKYLTGLNRKIISKKSSLEIQGAIIHDSELSVRHQFSQFRFKGFVQ
jgi:hypothetical protein